MASISIKNIGPLSDTGTIELACFNIIIGKQSTGKSTLMKILCFCQWLEKSIMTGDENLLYAYTHYSRFLKELKQFHRLSDKFFSPQSEIHYVGECIDIDLVGNKNVRISRNSDFEQKRHNTKLSFIPSERNLVSAIKNVDRAYRSNDNDVLFNHLFEWGEAKEHTSENHPTDLSVVGNMEYYYDVAKDTDTILLRDTRKTFTPFYASSGVQSVLPIVVMTDYFTGPIFSNTVDLSKKNVTDFFRKITDTKIKDNQDFISIISQVSRVFNYQNARLFIEEPEQNLFPESQQALIEHIVAHINAASLKTGIPSSVTITTHSPYIITAFNVLIKAARAAVKNPAATYEIVPEEQIVPIEKVRAYYIHENGTLSDIRDTEIGMISGIELDHASDMVEDKLTKLTDVIYVEHPE